MNLNSSMPKFDATAFIVSGLEKSKKLVKEESKSFWTNKYANSMSDEGPSSMKFVSSESLVLY
jgi:hypothetical protein